MLLTDSHTKTLHLMKRLAEDFPCLNGTTFLDSAATTQMPVPVLDAMSRHYRLGASNVHRGVYPWAERADLHFEESRHKVAQFIGATSDKECIFTYGTTDSLNLLATSWGEANVKPGDVVVVTQMEHHSSLLPWTQLAERRGAEVLWWGVTEDGELDMSQLPEVLERRPRVAALTWVSNVLGTINPIKEIAAKFSEIGTTVVLDGAQGVPHLPTNVQELGVDFLAFSGHKMCAPTGTGVLWGKMEHLEAMPPYRFGGSMILSVRQDRVLWAEVPHKFEGGTPHIAGVHGLGAAIDYLGQIGMDAVREHEVELTRYCMEKLLDLEGLTIFGPSDPLRRSGVISFDFRGIHPHDLATILARQGVCVRAGHHCCQPLMRCFRRQGTTRASFYFYSTRADVDALVGALEGAAKIFKGYH